MLNILKITLCLFDDNIKVLIILCKQIHDDHVFIDLDRVTGAHRLTSFKTMLDQHQSNKPGAKNSAQNSRHSKWLLMNCSLGGPHGKYHGNENSEISD